MLRAHSLLKASDIWMPMSWRRYSARSPAAANWNSSIAVLRNSGLIETDGRCYRAADLFRD
jgi:hypothetical protein